jgi:hypothetical protein
MSAINPGIVEAHTVPASGVKQIKDVTMGAMALQEPDAVAITGGTAFGVALSGAIQSAITAAGAVDVNANHVSIVGPATSTYAITLAAPARAGQLLAITMTSTTSTNAVTLALTNVIGGSAASTATFNAAGETLVLVSTAEKWVVVAEAGVTLS